MSSWYWPRSASRNCRLPQSLFHTETEFLAGVSAQVEPSTGNDPHRDGKGGRASYRQAFERKVSLARIVAKLLPNATSYTQDTPADPAFSCVDA